MVRYSLRDSIAVWSPECQPSCLNTQQSSWRDNWSQLGASHSIGQHRQGSSSYRHYSLMCGQCYNHTWCTEFLFISQKLYDKPWNSIYFTTIEYHHAIVKILIPDETISKQLCVLYVSNHYQWYQNTTVLFCRGKIIHEVCNHCVKILSEWKQTNPLNAIPVHGEDSVLVIFVSADVLIPSKAKSAVDTALTMALHIDELVQERHNPVH